VLKQAYTILFVLFAALGLVLEHDKTELFHFDRSHSNHNPPLDLGYTPYTGNRLLTPKTYWRYLGFYFDQKLLFTEHVRYYATKSFSTVQVMGMLGNSTQGLPPLERHLLYRACVLPIREAPRRITNHPHRLNGGERLGGIVSNVLGEEQLLIEREL